jgi:hypothetical protein
MDNESTSETSIRYAPYVEEHHESFLNTTRDLFNADRVETRNPYSTLFSAAGAPDDVDWMVGFYGAGYTMSSFPSLYDMYGKFLAGLDIEVLWEQSLDSTHDNAAVSALTHAHADILDEQITDDVLPRFRAGLRDMNAITSSSYWIGVSNIEAKRDHDVANFDAELRYRLIPVAAERWANHLKWNHDVILMYQDIIKSAVLVKTTQDDHNYKNRQAYIMWPWSLLEQYRGNIGALTGATTSKTKQEESPLGMILGIAAVAGSLFV